MCPVSYRWVNSRLRIKLEWDSKPCFQHGNPVLIPNKQLFATWRAKEKFYSLTRYRPQRRKWGVLFKPNRS